LPAARIAPIAGSASAGSRLMGPWPAAISIRSRSFLNH